MAHISRNLLPLMLNTRARPYAILAHRLRNNLGQHQINDSGLEGRIIDANGQSFTKVVMASTAETKA